jgi:3-hydroxyacyl-[acyl-carrier-protein] dehydratase
MRMVDFVRSFSPGPPPVLEASRHVSVNEPFFEGHFDGLPIWPGVLTIEGLGQSCAVLMIVTALRREAESRDEDPDTVLEALRNLDRGGRMHPGFRPGDASRFLDTLRSQHSHLAVGAAVDVKFLQPVFAGSRLDYHVEWSADLGRLVRFDVEASVEGEPVVRGTVTGARIELPERPGA